MTRDMGSEGGCRQYGFSGGSPGGRRVGELARGVKWLGLLMLAVNLVGWAGGHNPNLRDRLCGGTRAPVTPQNPQQRKDTYGHKPYDCTTSGLTKIGQNGSVFSSRDDDKQANNLNWFTNNLTTGVFATALALLVLGMLTVRTIASIKYRSLKAKLRRREITRQRPVPYSEHAKKRIDNLIQVTRATWFGYLSFFTYIGIALMGYDEKVFFLDNSRSDLPLIGVSVPTEQIFVFGPMLGVAIYGYFHAHLSPLWRELGRTESSPKNRNGHPEPLSDRISPSLIADMALKKRGAGSLRHLAFRGFAALPTEILLFWVGPIILFFYWFESMTAHKAFITVGATGISFSLSLYILIRGYIYFWHEMLRIEVSPGQGKPGLSWLTRFLVLTVLVLAVGAVGWFRTEGTTTQIRDWWAKNINKLNAAQVAEVEREPTRFPSFLANIDLADIDFVEAPQEFLGRVDDRQLFFIEHCEQSGIPEGACAAQTRKDRSYLDHTGFARASWCGTQLRAGQDCEAYFKEYEKFRRVEWDRSRERAINDMKKVDLSGRDLRGADLRRSILYGARFVEARLQRAKLSGARLEGADLRFARLQEAELRLTRLEAANLRGARFDGAILQQTLFDHRTDFGGYAVDGRKVPRTSFKTAAMKSVDLRGTAISRAQVEEMFGDASVMLPTEIPVPAHWPGEDLSWREFQAEWREWRSGPNSYKPPYAHAP